MRRYSGKNFMPFTAVCGCSFGRQVIYTRENLIDDNNVLAELQKALPTHEQNAIEIEYLDRYYKGDQPILYRHKKNRPEVNNKVVVNIAQFIVDVNAANVVSEPIQYVLHGTDDTKAEMLRKVNEYVNDTDKECDDIELCRWRSICGTAYRYVGQSEENDHLFASAPFSLSVENPCKTFVVYYDDKRPAFSCQIRKNSNNNVQYWIYTARKWYVIEKDTIIESGINGNGAIPVVEYPNNARRLSDIEITITLTDEINKLTADRANGIEQYVASWVKFVNCDIDIAKFRELREEGFFSVKSNNGSEGKADVELMGRELDQSQTQVAVDDLLDKLLVIQGIANREGNTGGDTGSAVELRNGHSAQEQKAKFNEPIFKRSEKATLRLILNTLRINERMSLVPTDVEIKITRSKNTNMLTKAEVLKMLLECGIEESIAIKTVDLFSDPEQVTYESRERIRAIFDSTKETEEPEEPAAENNIIPEQQETPETVNDNETNAENR